MRRCDMVAVYVSPSAGLVLVRDRSPNGGQVESQVASPQEKSLHVGLRSSDPLPPSLGSPGFALRGRGVTRGPQLAGCRVRKFLLAFSI